jgi:hypothetical protein
VTIAAATAALLAIGARERVRVPDNLAAWLRRSDRLLGQLEDLVEGDLAMPEPLRLRLVELASDLRALIDEPGASTAVRAFEEHRSTGPPKAAEAERWLDYLLDELQVTAQAHRPRRTSGRRSGRRSSAWWPRAGWCSRCGSGRTAGGCSGTARRGRGAGGQ